VRLVPVQWSTHSRAFLEIDTATLRHLTHPKLSLRYDNDLTLLPQITNDYFYPCGFDHEDFEAHGQAMPSWYLELICL
jgi:hypothetical protein